MGGEFERRLRELARRRGDVGGRAPLDVLEELGVRARPKLEPSLGSWVGDGIGEPEVGRDGTLNGPIGFAETLGIDELAQAFTEEASAVDFALGEEPRLGRYPIVTEIGRGGMGRVLEVLDPDLGRILAVKVLRAGRVSSREALERFVGEARLTAQLEHPHIVPIHEVGLTREGELYYAMKKVEGDTLAQVLADREAGITRTRTRWPLRRLLGAFVKVCQAAGYAHRRGVVHQDLKPGNIMLGSFGEVLLLDWGLAALTTDPDERPGSATGTPGYLSPEQARGRGASGGPRSDVYSLGAVLYEIITGSQALPCSSTSEYLLRVTREEVQDPRDRASERRIPAELATICLRALALDPSARFADGRALGRALEEFLEGARRRERADGCLAEAERAWESLNAARNKHLAAVEVVRRLEEGVQSWTPIEEKADLLAACEDRDGLALAQARAFSEVVAAGERALAHDPDHAGARALLARAYYRRFEEAEERGDAAEQVLYALRVREYDDGPLRALLRGEGSLTVQASPREVEVVARLWRRQGVLLALGPERALGPAPLRRVPLPAGSWLLSLRGAGAEVSVPVWIPRGGEGVVDVTIPQESPPGFCWIPGGRARLGDDGHSLNALPRREEHVPGFWLARDPVTVADWLGFLDHLLARDPEEAWAREPRSGGGVNTEPTRYLPRPRDGRYRLPDADADGDVWDLRFPIFGISAEDAEAYAAWRTEVTGRRHRLPTEDEWEKAGRGPAGRSFPWGEAEEATLCWSADAQPGRPQPSTVGSLPHDVSVYGVRDLAGGISEWTSSSEGGGERRVFRGGSWASTLRQCRLASRSLALPTRVSTFLGARMALDE